ncbi:MAG: pantetheine-phosphate adenylyltransferase [Crocinitomicaceae bacterium]|nr:pantetheine-phosphate adenylyltransferase [Crocinitomicaceae bacterium]
MKKVGLFPGSFDPFTKGHEIVVKKSLHIFDEVIIGVGVNSSKKYMFELHKRIAHINSLFVTEPNVNVAEFQTLTVNFCKEIGASHIIRGLRDSKDFQYEKSIAHMNFDISGIDTVFFLTEQRYSAINSSIIREINKNGGPIDSFVTNPHKLV